MDKLLVLLVLCSVIELRSASITSCAIQETHFQKIIGYYPLTSSSTINWDHLRPYTTPLECLAICKEDLHCSGFIYHVIENKCSGVDLRPSLNEALDKKLVHDPAFIFYEKVCLNVPEECRESNKAWPILRIPATTLIGAGFKHINRLVTRRQCIELCLFESEFLCKSAAFRQTQRNNYNRERERDFNEDPFSLSEDKPLGECILSREDKNSKPDAFRVANDVGTEYIENQCVPQDFVENQCSYERYLNASFLYADFVISGLSDVECQERCDTESRFKCIGVTYSGRWFPAVVSSCALHSDDIISLGPRALRATTESEVYMRRVRCLNVNVICDRDTMIVRYLPEQYFVGKLYVNAPSRKNCSAQSADDLGLLRIPIGNETRENSCGIVRAYQLAKREGRTMTPTHNRTLISATIVIQTHPSVQSQGDRLIKVGCILNGSGKGSGADRQSKLLDVVESEIQVAGLDVPNIGPSALRPTVQLVDLDNNIESKVVEVGENLQLRVFYPDDVGYDLEVVNMKASSPSGQELYLLDYRGCSVDASIFPEMIFTDIDGVLTLVGQFVAFKFASSPYVDLSMTVRSCYKTCPPRKCQKLSRQKRQDVINPIVFPSVGTSLTPATGDAAAAAAGAPNPALTPINFPMPIPFPNSSNRYMVDKQLVDEEGGNTVPESLHNGIEHVVYQRVISSFDEPFEEKIKKLADTNNVEIKELFKNFSKMIEYPITMRLQVFFSSENINPESLIYGENSFALDGDDSPTRMGAANTICVDQTFILCLLLFFGILVIVLVIGCSLLLMRYKRKLQQEEDLSSLHRFHFGFEPFDSLSRRVHWADGFANPRSAYP